MLARSSSSRRRRASRSVASSAPQRATSGKGSTKESIAAAAAATTAAALDVEDGGGRSRRASMAVISGSVPALGNRSPRNSIAVPQVSENNLLSVSSNNRSRGSISITEGTDLLHPGKFPGRSRGSSFSEHASDSLLCPGGPGSRSARGSFSVPDGEGLLAPGSRSARGSFAAADGELLLQPPMGTRSARGSFSSPNSEIQISVSGTRSARASFSVPGDSSQDIGLMSRSPRESFSMPLDRRRTEGFGLVPPEASGGRSRSGSVAVEFPTRSPRGSICPELMNKSPRGSISEFNRSPRGSIGPDFNRSPRGSLGPDQSRSPRGSIGPDGIVRSPRTSPRGSLPDASPRGSFAAAGLQGSPRNSIDLGRTGSMKARGGAIRLATRGEQCESRRASSSVSQVSVDDRRQLCEQSKLNPEAGTGHTVYGSVVYQLKDANMEASGGCDFTCRALRIVYKTATVTVILVCLSTLPLAMLIMGVNYLRECPKEPNLPVYMVVGGSFGIIRMVWAVWSQVRSRRYDRLDIMAAPPSSCEDGLLPSNIAVHVASAALTIFLLVWFGLGNYWTFHIFMPAFEQHSYFEPNQWCSKGLYIFSLVHLGILYIVIAALLGLTIVLSCCYVFSCSLVVRYS